MISNSQLIEMIFQDHTDIAIWDKSKNIGENVEYAFSLLCDIVKYDYANGNGLIELIPGEHYYLKMREGNKLKNHVVRFGGINEKRSRDKSGEPIRQLVLDLYCATEEYPPNSYVPNSQCCRFQNLRAADYIWRLSPAAKGTQLTPLVRLDGNILDDTPDIKLAEKCGIPIDKFCRIKRTHVVWIPSGPIDETIELLRSFYSDGYGFLEYFATQRWVKNNSFQKVSTKRYARRESERCFLSLFNSFSDFNLFLQNGIQPDESYLIISDNFRSLFNDLYTLANLKVNLSKYREQIHLLYFGDLINAEKLLRKINEIEIDRIKIVYPFKFLFPNFEVCLITDIYNNIFDVGDSTQLMMDEFLSLAKVINNVELKITLETLIRNFHMLEPRSETHQACISILKSNATDYKINMELLTAFENLDIDNNPKMSFMRGLAGEEDNCLVCGKSVKLSGAIKFGDLYRKIFIEQLTENKNLFIPEIYHYSNNVYTKIIPLALMGYISINQIFPVLYNQEKKYVEWILKKMQKALTAIGISHPEIVTMEAQIDIPASIDDYFDEIIIDKAINGDKTEKCTIFYLSGDEKDFLLPINSASKQLYIMKDGKLLQVNLEDVEVGDTLVYFNSNYNILGEFEEFENVMNSKMIDLAEEWKRLLIEYYSSDEFNIQEFTNNLNIKGLNVGEQAVKGWILEERIGTMNPQKDFPIIAETIGNQELSDKIQEYAFACRYLQSRSKQLGRWLMKVSRRVLKGEAIEEISGNMSEELREKITQLITKYQILTVIGISTKEYDVAQTGINNLREI